MKVLALNFNQKGVGTWRRSFYFSRELARAGHDVTLMTVSRSSRFRGTTSYKRDWIGESTQPLGLGPWVRLIEGPAWGYRLLPGWGSGPLDIWQRVREIFSGDFEAVLGFEHHPNVSWPVYLTQGRKQFSFFSDWCDWFGGNGNHFRGWRLAHRLDTYLEEKIRLRAQRVSVTSRVLFDRALSIGIPRERIVQISEGAATDYIVPFCQRQARESVKLPLDVPILLQVRNGDMCREIRIFREVLRKVPNALFLMVGSPSRSALELAERLDISSRVYCTGWVSDEDYPVYLACADVCFCPLELSLCDQARWPAKILDYLSAGRATVTNPIGEVTDLFRRREVGVLAGHGDDEFAGELAALVLDLDRRQFLGTTARKTMVEEWDWHVRGRQIASMLAIQ